MTGGISHVDIFDTEPFLRKNHYPLTSQDTVCNGCGWHFRSRGRSGIRLSVLLPEIRWVIDESVVVGEG